VGIWERPAFRELRRRLFYYTLGWPILRLHGSYSRWKWRHDGERRLRDGERPR